MAVQPARIRHKTLGTVLRIIRTAVDNGGLYWVCRDETYGAVCRLSVLAYATGDWETV